MTQINAAISSITNATKLFQSGASDIHYIFLEAFQLGHHLDIAQTALQSVIAQDADLGQQLAQYQKDGTVDPQLDSGYKKDIVKLVKLAERAQKQREEFMRTAPSAKDIDAQRLQYIKYLKDEADNVRSSLDKILSSNPPGKPALDIAQFKRIMSADSFDFWTKINSSSTEVTWAAFSETHRVLFGNIKPEYEAFVKEFLCPNGANGTLLRFVSLTQRLGFPFHTCTDEHVMSEDKRVDITESMMNLMKEFADESMRGHLQLVYQWFITAPDSSIDDRAKEWATVMKEARNTADEAKSDKHKRAQAIDLARRSVSMFYQRYMLLWKIGPSSREVLKGVDTPGKARMRDFIKYFLPLDKYNYAIVIGSDLNAWESKRPIVYDFLQKLI
ncbi:hypothetical protein BJV82DRAFT_667948 [Fennellomyces sp. T-0311]|nr:hypothetical protein BJV82DRAFT_667948 [Fennellomyces sp. T-0311]